MTTKDQTISFLAALLVLFSAMIDPRISALLALLGLVVLLGRHLSSTQR
ncbi:MAG: hypothetical protein RBT47_11935 [Anaerolineae bacterium]|jgi:hypothetical protein|nr:hypothetical protein [Anaerolineae bacterium]